MGREHVHVRGRQVLGQAERPFGQHQPLQEMVRARIGLGAAQGEQVDLGPGFGQGLDDPGIHAAHHEQGVHLALEEPGDHVRAALLKKDGVARNHPVFRENGPDEMVGAAAGRAHGDLLALQLEQVGHAKALAVEYPQRLIVQRPQAAQVRVLLGRGDAALHEGRVHPGIRRTHAGQVVQGPAGLQDVQLDALLLEIFRVLAGILEIGPVGTARGQGDAVRRGRFHVLPGQPQGTGQERGRPAVDHHIGDPVGLEELEQVHATCPPP